MSRTSTLMGDESKELPASTGITPDSLAAALKEKLEASHVEIEDLSGTDGVPLSRKRGSCKQDPSDGG